MQVVENTARKNLKMVRPVGFEPTSMVNFRNKINVPILLRAPLETLTCGFLCEISKKVKLIFQVGMFTQ
jgi:hypothetical protein